ncbi:unnamed protein product [Candida verbasci]|uniref:Translocation protein SEC62 n=1 Tax=Candida verbasci TaxID=1227364 RepID=A0A9W4TSN5_9ASCO|nr:unnamed protein product [Candida verbasci]
MSNLQPTGQSQQVQVKTNAQTSPLAINVARYLYQNPILKQRTGLLNGETDLDFFRYKRFERALLSQDYKTKQVNPKNGLPPIKDQIEVQKIFVMLIQNQLILPINKLLYNEIKQEGWKPNKEKPTLKKSDKAVLEPNYYYGWLYSKPNPFILLYSFLAIAGVFTIILFPLWPTFMKTGVWYLSMGALGLIGLFFLTAIIRLIIYIISLVAFPYPFWLFPNLFADCGVIESFKPLYGWEKPKKKKGKKQVTTNETTNESGKSTSIQSNGSTVNKRKVTLEEVEE